MKTLVHRIRKAWRIEDGWLGWTVSAIFGGHIFPVYGNHTKHSTDRGIGR